MTTQKPKPRSVAVLNNTVHAVATDLAYEAVDSIKDKCVLNSVYGIEIHIYTDYGVITKSIKV